MGSLQLTERPTSPSSPAASAGGIKAVPPTSWEGGNEVPRPLWAHPAPPARDGNSQGVGQGTAGVGLEPPARRGERAAGEVLSPGSICTSL